jgi:hypothetical protein
MISKYQEYSNLIREYAVGNYGEQDYYTFFNSSGDFDAAVSYLISHVNSRYNSVLDYLGK